MGRLVNSALRLACFGLLAAAALAAAADAKAKESVLYSFSGGNDGGNAATAIARDASGNLFGSTVVGGTSTCGTVFELSPPTSGPWHETVLHNFGCFADGKSPHGGVSFDPSGTLIGTTVAGGSGGFCASDGCGVVYRQAPSGQTVLYNFTGQNDGGGPGGGVVFDKAGDMFGTTPDDGQFAEGTVYELVRGGSTYTLKTIHAFTGGKDGGVGSLGSLLIDANGNLFGVTEIGGANSGGTVFEMSQSGKKWKFKVLYTFKGGSADGSGAYGGLVADAQGRLYGTTYYGGAQGLGTVFVLTPNKHGNYNERVLHNFTGGSDGSFTTSTLAFGRNGNLYGTTSSGGSSCDCGVIYEISPKSGKERVLHVFGGTNDGAFAYYGMTADANGNFYGATVEGGALGQGAVYEFFPGD
jgi:uncharacterized repeat protein (TIGR03803 family)